MKISGLKIEPGSDSDATVVDETFAEPSADSFLSFKKEKKKKILDSTFEAGTATPGTRENQSQSLLGMLQIEANEDPPNEDSCREKKKKKKRKRSAASESSIIEESFASIDSPTSLNGKKKKKKLENWVLNSVIEDSFTSTVSVSSSNGKKKHKNAANSESESLPSVIEDSFASVGSVGSFIKKKKKRKRSENDESQSTNDSEGFSIKKQQSENNESQSTIDSDNSIVVKKKKKKKQWQSENDPSQSTIDTDNSIVVKKKKKKKQWQSENDESQSTIDSDNSIVIKKEKKKKKKKSENDPSLMNENEPSSLNFDSDASLIKKKKQKLLEYVESQSTIDLDNSIVVKKKKKKKQRLSENDESQSTIDSDNSIVVKKKKKKRQKNLENDASLMNEIEPSSLNFDSDASLIKKKKQKLSEAIDSENRSILNETHSDNLIVVKKKKKKRSKIKIEPSLLTIDCDGSFIKKEKHNNSESEGEVEPSLLTIDSFGSFIEKKKPKNMHLTNSSSELISNETDSSLDKVDGSLKGKKRKIELSDQVVPQKTKKAKKSQDSFTGNSIFFCSTPETTPKKPDESLDSQNEFPIASVESPKNYNQNNFLDSKRIKQEKCSSDANTSKKEDFETLESKQQTLNEIFDELLEEDHKDAKHLERFSPSQDSSKENSNGQEAEQGSESDQEEVAKDNSTEDYQFKLAVCQLSMDIDFQVPELHKILNRSSKPTSAQRALLEAKGLKPKRGKFTKDEDKIVMENWQYFVQLSGIADRPQLFFCLRNSRIPLLARRNFLYYLSRNLPDRTPCSIFNRFKLLTNEAKKGRFTKAEDDYITSLISSRTPLNHPVKEMAEHLKRTRLSVEQRIVKLLKAHTRKIKWKKNNAAAFIKYLLRATDCSEVEGLRNRPIARSEWDYLSKKLDHVPVRILVRAWKERLHPALFIAGNKLDYRKVKMKLVKMFKENGEKEWKRVNWSKYASRFEGLTAQRVYTLMKQMVAAYVPEEKRGNLKKCIKILAKMSEDNLYKLVLYKMVYKNGAVREIKDK